MGRVPGGGDAVGYGGAVITTASGLLIGWHMPLSVITLKSTADPSSNCLLLGMLIPLLLDCRKLLLRATGADVMH